MFLQNSKFTVQSESHDLVSNNKWGLFLSTIEQQILWFLKGFCAGKYQSFCAQPVRAGAGIYMVKQYLLYGKAVPGARLGCSWRRSASAARARSAPLATGPIHGVERMCSVLVAVPEFGARLRGRY